MALIPVPPPGDPEEMIDDMATAMLSDANWWVAPGYDDTTIAAMNIAVLGNPFTSFVSYQWVYSASRGYHLIASILPE